MEKKIDSSGMLEKIRAAGCLTDGEMETLTKCLAVLETRQEIDALDERWAFDIRKYIQQRRTKGGKPYDKLPSSDEVWAFVFVGVMMLCWGGYMLSQLSFTTTFEYLPALFFAFIAAAGGRIIFLSVKTRKEVNDYQAALNRFRDARQSLTAKLPSEFRPARQICRECLSTIAEVHH